MRAPMLAMISSLALTLSACGSETSGTIEGEDGEVGEYTIDADSGEASMTITTEDGTATMRTGDGGDVDLPDGFTVYPGAEVIGNTSFKEGETVASMVMMEISATPKEVVEHYRKQAEAAGINIEFEMSVDGGQMLGGQDKTGRSMTLNATEESEGTLAQLSVGYDPSMAEE